MPNNDPYQALSVEIDKLVAETNHARRTKVEVLRRLTRLCAAAYRSAVLAEAEYNRPLTDKADAANRRKAMKILTALIPELCILINRTLEELKK